MKVKFTMYQKVMEILSAAILMLLISYLLLSWPAIPDKVPAHYNASGVIDSWQDKGSIVFMPIVACLLYALLTVVSHFPATWNIPVKITEENKFRVYTKTRNLICSMKSIIIVAFTYITLYISKAQPLSGLFLPVFLIAIFGTIIISIILIVRSAKEGTR